MNISKRGGMMAAIILASIGGLAAKMVATVKNDVSVNQAPVTNGSRFRITGSANPAGSKPMGRGKGFTGQAGLNLMNHFDHVRGGINWSAKPSRIRAAA